MNYQFSVVTRLVRVRLTLMVTFSALTGYFLAGCHPDLSLFYLFSGLFLLSTGASALNQVQESRQDALMNRTAHRPIPAGEISMVNALLIAFILIAGGAFMLRFNGKIPMILGLLNVVFYNLMYTPLKTRSWLAIVPGAIVGGVPPLIGWSSAGLDLFHPNAIFLFVFVCLWQVPHFWLLMIKYGKEYEKAGFSSITRFLDENQIKMVVFGWGVVTSVFLMLFPFFGFNLKPFVVVTILIINLLFIRYFYLFLFFEKKTHSIRNAFILINSYALIVFVMLIVNALIS